MSYCRNCGKRLPDNARFCSECGTSVIMSKRPKKQRVENRQVPVNKRDLTHTFDPEDIRKNKDSSYLCYVSVLALMPACSAAEDSKYIRFHANQGLCLAIAEVIALLMFVAGKLITEHFFDSVLLVFVIFPALFVIFVAEFFGLLAVIFSFFGMAQLHQGVACKIPIFGNFDILGKFYKNS